MFTPTPSKAAKAKSKVQVMLKQKGKEKGTKERKANPFNPTELGLDERVQQHRPQRGLMKTRALHPRV